MQTEPTKLILNFETVKTFNPANSIKYSPNLYQWLSNRGRWLSRTIVARDDQEGKLYIGFFDEKWFSGVLLGRVLAVGRKAESTCPIDRTFTEIPDFWEKYAAVGRCAIDAEHVHDLKDRWKVEGDKRRCQWCGHVQHLYRWKQIVDREAWRNDEPTQKPTPDLINTFAVEYSQPDALDAVVDSFLEFQNEFRPDEQGFREYENPPEHIANWVDANNLAFSPASVYCRLLERQNKQLERNLRDLEETKTESYERTQKALLAIANSDRELVERFLAGSELFRHTQHRYIHYVLGKIRQSRNLPLLDEVFRQLPTGYGAVDRMAHEIFDKKYHESTREIVEFACEIAAEATGKTPQVIREEIHRKCYEKAVALPLELQDDFLVIQLAKAKAEVEDLKQKLTPSQTPLEDSLYGDLNEAFCCLRCNPKYRFFPACTKCGNKRCPHATFHENACTRSNVPGQQGSDY